jgi:NACHT domain
MRNALPVMARGRTAPASALGGSHNERGSEYRAYVGALLASCVLREESLAAIQLTSSPGQAILLEAEGDRPVDDLVIETAEGHRTFFQAKASAGLTRGDTPFAKTLIQFAKALDADLGEEDRLVLACGTATKPLRALGRLLSRYQLTSQGNPDPKEARALAAFREIVGAVVPNTDPERLMERMVIWETDPSEGDARLALESRLEPQVAAAGKGGRAARELANTVRKLARMRGGLDALGLVGELRRREVPLSPGGPPSSPVQQGIALSRHRGRIRRQGETLRLLGVSGRLADIPFEVADAQIEVKVPEDDDSRFGHDPVLALRRRGRALLIGRPGGGKSTALRSIGAHWAARADWPIPISVHLHRLADNQSGFTAALLEAATDELAGSERIALKEALEHELARGRCLLLLDGLDEVRRGRKIFAADLSAWLKNHLHPDVEILLASRPVALADAATTGLPSLELLEPESPGKTAAAILRAAATEEIEEEQRDAWIAQRQDWLAAVFKRNRELSTTPLMVVLLALAAARSQNVTDLPSRRAQVLKQSVEDALREWELEARRKGRVAIGSLTGESAAAALRGSFCLLGERAIGDSPPTRTEVEAELSTWLAEHFDLAPGNAGAAASEAVTFWEEAGLFAFDQSLVANVRSLAELGSAWRAEKIGPDQQRQWVRTVRSEEDLWPCLSLAAGLSGEIAELWAAELATGGCAAELAALLGAHRDGVAFTPESMRSVGTGLAASVLTNQDEAEDTAWGLIGLPLDKATREFLRPLLTQAVPASRKPVVEAWAILRWDEQGAEADARLRKFVSGPQPPPPQKQEEEHSRRIFLRLESDGHFDAAFREGALRLAAGKRSDAELVISRLDEVDFELSPRLRAALKRGGNEDLEVPERQISGFKGFDWKPGDFDASEQKMLGWVAEGASPAQLTWSERRRLTEIVDLWESFRANWISPRWPLDRPALAKAWINAAVALGGFDAALLAAEADQILAELEKGDDVTSMLFDGGEARELADWQAVKAPAETVRQLIDTIGKASRQVTVAICGALEKAPTELGVADLLAERVGQLRAWSHWFVATTLLNISPDAQAIARKWQASDDPLLRSPAAMWWVQSLIIDGMGEDEVLLALGDTDDGVREWAVRMLPESWEVPPRIRRRLEEIANEPPSSWRCRWCGTDNDSGEKSGCSKCHTTGPEPSRQARKLLEHL